MALSLSDATSSLQSNLEARLLCAVCRVFGVTEAQLISADRQGVSEARWALAYVLVSTCGWSYSKVGRLLNKNHTAIMYGFERARTLLRTSEPFFEAVQIIEDSI